MKYNYDSKLRFINVHYNKNYSTIGKLFNIIFALETSIKSEMCFDVSIFFSKITQLLNSCLRLRLTFKLNGFDTSILDFTNYWFNFGFQSMLR